MTDQEEKMLEDIIKQSSKVLDSELVFLDSLLFKDNLTLHQSAILQKIWEKVT